MAGIILTELTSTPQNWRMALFLKACQSSSLKKGKPDGIYQTLPSTFPEGGIYDKREGLARLPLRRRRTSGQGGGKKSKFLYN